MPRKISEKIKNKTAQERANLKGQEIAKIKPLKTKRGNLEIEITEIEAIEGGVELFARARTRNNPMPVYDLVEDGIDTKGEKTYKKVLRDIIAPNTPIGFGKDGSVDLERFRIYNPPILVDDPNGTIIREWTEERTGEFKQRKLKEDPKEALLQSLEHTIEIVGKDGKVIKGKRGNTTSTFYPDADAESSSVDGTVREQDADWATARSAGSGNFVDDSGGTLYSHINPDGSQYNIWRAFIVFDTSSLPDTDTIDSATLSTEASTVNDDINDAYSYTNLVTGGSTASDTAIATGDYDTLNDTKASDTNLDHGSVSTGSYTDWTLNSDGLSNISKTGASYFGLREGHDVANQDPGNSSDVTSGIYWDSADTAGTTQDPKLVVEHSSTTTYTKTKSLQYSVVTSNSTAKSLQYTVKAAVSIFKSLKYTITTTPSATVKSLTYAITTTPSALSKSLQYAVIKANSAVKSLKYTLVTSSSKTKSLQYAVTTTPSATVKSLRYAIAKAISTSKSLQYAVTKAQSSINKSLKYTVVTTPTATSKSLQYIIVLRQQIVKSLQYAVSASKQKTKSLKYTVITTPSAKTKSLKYSIVTTPSATTKVLQYAVAVSQSISRQLKYVVVERIKIVKSLSYNVFVPVSIQKSLKYSVYTTSSLVKSLGYSVITQTRKTKSLQYAVLQAPTAMQKQLQYSVRTQPTLTKSLKYEVFYDPYNKESDLYTPI